MNLRSSTIAAGLLLAVAGAQAADDQPTNKAAAGNACFNPPTTPPPKDPDKPTCPICPRTPGCTSGKSVIIDSGLNYIHTGIDYQVYAGDEAGGSGCVPCGSAGDHLADEIKYLLPPSLEIVRYFRPLTTGWASSFGPAMIADFDVSLTWSVDSAGIATVRLRDPASTVEMPLLLVNGVWTDQQFGIIRSASIVDANGAPVTDLTLAASATIITNGGRTYQFEHVLAARQFRPLSVLDRRGFGKRFTYVQPVSVVGDAAANFKIAAISDDYGRVARPAYAGTKVSGRFVVTSILLPNGKTVRYSYANSRLSRVDHPDGSATTFSVTVDADQELVKYAFFDPAADKPTSRSRAVFVTPSAYVQPDGSMLSVSANRVRKVLDGTGQLTYWTHLMPLTLPWGHRLAIAVYGGGNKMYQLQLSEGRVLAESAATQWSFSSAPETWSWGEQRAYAYSAQGRPVVERDVAGNVTAYELDPATGIPTKTTLPDGAVETREVGPFALPLSETDALGRVTTYTYNTVGCLLSKTMADGTAVAATESWTYDATNRVTSHTDALGRVTAYSYSAAGLLVAVTRPADGPGMAAPTWRIAYDAAGNQVGVTDPDGRAVTTQLDARNRPVRITYADGSFESFAYGTGADAGLRVASTDRNGVMTTYQYDAEGREVRRVLAAGTPMAAVTDTAYVMGTALVAAKSENGVVTTYAYDHDNQLVGVTRQTAGSVAQTETTVRDGNGRTIATMDAYGRSRYVVYDERGRSVRTVQELVSHGVDMSERVRQALAERFGTNLSVVGPWIGADIGMATPAGSATLASIGGVFGVKLVSSNTGFTGKEDKGYFYGQALPGDGELVVRLDEHTFTNSATKAGIMVRASRDPDAPFIFLLKSGSGVEVHIRRLAGYSVEFMRWSIQGIVSMPQWMRMTRRGSVVSYDISDDGVIWNYQGMVHLPLGMDTVIGLAAAGRGTTTATFANLSLTKGGDYPSDVIDAVRATVLAGLPRLTGGNPAYAVMDSSYDAAGRLATRIDGRGTMTRFSYDAQGREIVRVEAAGTAAEAVTRTSYDLVGNPVRIVGPRGQVTALTYTGRNMTAVRAEAVAAAESATTSFTYTATGKAATVTDALGRVTRNIYGACCDRLEQVIDPLGFVTRFTYDPVGSRMSVTDGNGLTATTAYDARRRPVAMTNAAGETTVIAYDDDLTDGLGIDAAYPAAIAGLGFGPGAPGSAVATKDPAGAVSVMVRDGMGRVVRTVDPLGNATTIVYDTVVDGLVETATMDPLGHTTRVRVDGNGGARIAVDADGQISTASFDTVGHRIATRDPLGVGQNCAFDERGREVRCTDTAGAVTQKAYDADGNLVREVDALGAVTTHAYDLRGRKAQTTDRIGAVTRFAYDVAGNLLGIQDGEGKVTAYAYDARNLLVREQFPQGQAGVPDVRTYTYDAGRRLATRTDQAGVVTTYAYDAANRLVSRSYGNGTPGDTFAYDRAGRLVQATAGASGIGVTRTYDAAGRLTQEAQVIDGIPFPVAYSYDAANRQIQMTYPDGTVVDRPATARGQLAAVALAGQPVSRRTYDAAGRLVRQDLGNGVAEVRSYVPGDRLVARIAATAAAGTAITDFRYTYDANKRKLSEVDGVQASAGQSFGYDPQDRLTAWSQGQSGATASATQTWALTAVGDWAATTRDGVTETRTHTDVHEIASINGAALTWDATGNLLTAPGLPALGWDVENRLISADGMGPMGLVQAHYAYDALGRRVQKTVNGLTTTWLSAGPQVVLAVTGRLLNAPWLNPLAPLITPPTPDLPTGAILAQSGPGVVRVTVQPGASATPDGWLADTGAAYELHGDRTYGWSTALDATALVDRAVLDEPTWDTTARMAAEDQAGSTWSIALPNGTYPVIVILGDAASREHTNTVAINGAIQTDSTPWIPGTPAGYEQGSFDGYAVDVAVTNGRLAIAPVPGQSWNPSLCCVEIGAQGTAIDAAVRERLADTVQRLTEATAHNRGTTPTVMATAYGSYVDEAITVRRMVRGQREQTYWVHANHLYSPAAVTDSAGVVVERYSHDAYGKQAITTPTGVAQQKSAVGFDRGFTGQTVDIETNLMYFRTRMYSPTLGRFGSRDPAGYVDGATLYNAYFVPRYQDPTGTELSCGDNGFHGHANGSVRGSYSSTPSVPQGSIAHLKMQVTGEVMDQIKGLSEKCPCECPNKKNETIKRRVIKSEYRRINEWGGAVKVMYHDELTYWEYLYELEAEAWVACFK